MKDTLKEIEDYFDIDITERDDDYLIKVTRRSDKKGHGIYNGYL